MINLRFHTYYLSTPHPTSGEGAPIRVQPASPSLVRRQLPNRVAALSTPAQSAKTATDIKNLIWPLKCGFTQLPSNIGKKSQFVNWGLTNDDRVVYF
jgi:hypothetical protein